MLEAVIFDVDGTLVDSVDLHARAWQDAFHHFGKDIAFEKIRNQIGKGGDQLMPVFIPREELQTIGEDIQDYRSKVYKAKYLQHVKPFPSVRELFERIKRDGRRIALASSAEKDEFEANLKLLQIGDLVDASTSSHDAERSKPFPDIFEAALSRLDGVKADRAIAVGDTPYDADAALQAGLRIIGMRCGGFPEHELRSRGCSEIWEDPEDLLREYHRSLLAA
jgi:HAD superfamily hydrolase (TIGR01509 family)